MWAYIKYREMIERYGTIAISTYIVLSDKIYVLYSGFLLFMVIMLYNVVKNIELANTESLFLGEKTRLGSYEPLITFLFIYNFILLFLLPDKLFNIYHDSLALNSASRIITYA